VYNIYISQVPVPILLSLELCVKNNKLLLIYLYGNWNKLNTVIKYYSNSLEKARIVI